MTEMHGQIVTIEFVEADRNYVCGLEDCECPDHDFERKPGTYVTVRMDEDVRIGLWRATVATEAPEPKAVVA